MVEDPVGRKEYAEEGQYRTQAHNFGERTDQHQAHKQRELTVTRLRALSLRQTSRLIGWLCDDAGLNLATPVADSDRVGFVALAVSGAAEVVRRLRHRGVYADARGSFLRFGPAPYVTDDELDRACAHILAACREVAA